VDGKLKAEVGTGYKKGLKNGGGRE